MANSDSDSKITICHAGVVDGKVANSGCLFINNELEINMHVFLYLDTLQHLLQQNIDSIKQGLQPSLE